MGDGSRAAKGNQRKAEGLATKMAKQERDLMFKIIGEVVLMAAQRPDFSPMLRAVLDEAERSEEFLREKGVI